MASMDTDMSKKDFAIHAPKPELCAAVASNNNTENEQQCIKVSAERVSSEAECIENIDGNGNLVIAEDPNQQGTTFLRQHFFLDDNTDSVIPITDVVQIKQQPIAEGIVLIGDQVFNIQDLLAAGSEGISFPINSVPIFIEDNEAVDVETFDSTQNLVIAHSTTFIKGEKIETNSLAKKYTTKPCSDTDISSQITQPQVIFANSASGILVKTHQALHREHTEFSAITHCSSTTENDLSTNYGPRPLVSHVYKNSTQIDIAEDVTSAPRHTSATVLPSNMLTNYDNSGKQKRGMSESTVNAQIESGPLKQASTSIGNKRARTKHVNKIYRCGLCSATFNRQGNYSRHRMIHTVSLKDDFRYKCETCGKKFLQRCDLVRHMTIHSGTEAHRCEICNKGYIRASDLRVHMKFHLKQRSFQCSQCDKAFIQSGDLNRHVRSVHHKVKQLTCGHCYKKFTKEMTLLRHMQTSHWQIIVDTLDSLGTTRDKAVISDNLLPSVAPAVTKRNVKSKSEDTVVPAM